MEILEYIRSTYVKSGQLKEALNICMTVSNRDNNTFITYIISLSNKWNLLLGIQNRSLRSFGTVQYCLCDTKIINSNDKL